MPAHGFIDDLYAEYLKSQIGGVDPVRAKRALQEVCSLYSRGLCFKPPKGTEVEIATVGQLELNMMDTKVRRWSLNVIALIGSADRSTEVIQRVIERYHNDPDTIASALTAFFKVHTGAYNDLRSRSYLSPEQIVLAGHIGGFGVRVKADATTINIEREGPPILRMALVAVGLRKAPENLFDPRYENAELVRQLSQHSDLSVAQYAVWAINEHPSLGVDHLGFEVVDAEGLPANMRSWTYRLYGEADISDAVRHEVVQLGAIDAEPEVRLNLARGLKDTWYDGLEEVTCDWFHQEQDSAVREELLDHLVHQSEQCTEYKRISLEAFDEVCRGGVRAQRMLASAKGRPLYLDFRRMEYQAEGDLFAPALPPAGQGDTYVTNNNFNVGNIQGGAVSLGGNAHQDGINTNQITGDQVLQLQGELQALAEQLRALPEQTGDMKDITALVETAAEDPSPPRLRKVREAVQSVLSGTGKLAKFSGDVAKIAETAEKIFKMLPPM